MAILVKTANANSSVDDVVRCSWGAIVHDAFRARDLVVANAKNVHINPSLESLLALINSLEDLTLQIAGLHKVDMNVREHGEQFISTLVQQPTTPIVNKLFNLQHTCLKEAYDQGLGFMVKTFQQYQNFLCIHALYSVRSNEYVGYEFPLDLMCKPIRNNLGQSYANDISADKVCKSVSECSKNDPFWVSQEEKNLIKTACPQSGTTIGITCDIKNALSIMGSLLWYKVSDFFTDCICYNYLLDSDIKKEIAVKSKSIADLVYFIKAYASTQTWQYFLSHAIEVGGFSELRTAMALVEEH